MSPSEDVQHTIVILTALSDDLERRYSEFRELLLSGSAFRLRFDGIRLVY